MEVRNADGAAGDPAKTAPARCSCWTGRGPAPRRHRFGNRHVGSAQPLLSDVYYLERALAPYAEIAKGTISQLLASMSRCCCWPMSARSPAATADAVKKFVTQWRRADPLRRRAHDQRHRRSGAGARCASAGAIWAAPWPGASRSIWRRFRAASPFNGLAMPDEVTVSRQVLAEPARELCRPHLGAAGRRHAAGHRAAAWARAGSCCSTSPPVPTWSSLPLSGLYVDMLKRLLALSAGTPARELARLTSLPPVSLLDGFGHTVPRRRPMSRRSPRSDFAHTDVSPQHPPGLYGAHGRGKRAECDGRASDTLLPLNDAGAQSLWRSAHAWRWSPGCWRWRAAAAAAGCAARAVAARLSRSQAALACGAAALLSAVRAACPAPAPTTPSNMKAALDTRLAYVETGLPDVDAISQAGLTGLGLALQGAHLLRAAGADGRRSGARRSVLLSPALLADGSAREKSVAQGAVAASPITCAMAAPSCSTPAI